jgi:hypothetical protein
MGDVACYGLFLGLVMGKGNMMGWHCGEVRVVGKTIEHTWAFDAKY